MEHLIGNFDPDMESWREGGDYPLFYQQEENKVIIDDSRIIARLDAVEATLGGILQRIEKRLSDIELQIAMYSRG